MFAFINPCQSNTFIRKYRKWDKHFDGFHFFIANKEGDMKFFKDI